MIWKYPSTVSFIKQSRQSMTCLVQITCSLKLYFTAIYASNIREERADIWAKLLDLHQVLSLENSSWLIGGDFNQIVHYAEHSSSYVDHLTLDIVELRDVFTTLGVNDLRYYGPSHTWSNKRPDDPVTKKLDRALVNDQWITFYPHSSVMFQAPKIADHSPCLIKMACPLPSSASKSYKFFNYLVKHPQFLTVAASAWSQNGPLAIDFSTYFSKLKALKKALKTLDKENYSGIQRRVSEVFNLFQFAQVSALHSPSQSSFQAERDLQEKWFFLRVIEESFLKNKSCINWLREGDQNTSFFYRIMASRNAWNSIRSITLANERMSTDIDEMSSTVVTHFQYILAHDVLPQLSSTLQWFFISNLSDATLISSGF